MRAEKKTMVDELAGLLQTGSAVLFSYQGLTANVFNGFRGKIAEIGGQCHVVPNKLLRKAAAQIGWDDLAAYDLGGDTAMVTGADAVALVRAVKEFAQGAKDIVKFKLSYVEGTLLDAKDTVALADLPPKEVVLAQLLGLIQAPASGIVRAINAKVASIVYCLKAIETKKEQTA